MKDRLPSRSSLRIWSAVLQAGCVLLLAPAAALAQVPGGAPSLYDLNTGLVSRSISFENPTGAPGEGGKVANKLGVGRKGSANKTIKPGETVQLCDIQGSGTIRHLWMTTVRHPGAEVLEGCVLRVWWDGQDHPSIECPIGNLFGMAHGQMTPYQSAVHSVSDSGMNLWLPMPFTRHARITFSNEGTKNVYLYYQVDYTLGDKHPEDVGRLHVIFRRENPTTQKHDFEILPERSQKGRYVGAVIGVRNLQPKNWWGEGEIKVYLDGDKEFPTIVGTGSEDYVGQGWGVQRQTYLYNGCSFKANLAVASDVANPDDLNRFVTMYRWHLPDPIVWHKSGRVTMQQLASVAKIGLSETVDDWSCSTFWYEPVPSAPLPPMPDVKARLADLDVPAPGASEPKKP